MKFYKPNDNDVKELSLIKLKLLTTLETSENWGADNDKEISYNLEFEVEAIKSITMVEKDKEKNLFTLYVNIRYLPEIFKSVKEYSDPGRRSYPPKAQKVRSPLWNT